MNVFPDLRWSVWLCVFAMAPLRAQDAPKKAPGPAPSMSEGVLEAWNDIGHKLITMAQDFPRGQIFVQAAGGLPDLCREPDPRFGVDVLLHGHFRGEEAAAVGLLQTTRRPPASRTAPSWWPL